MSRRLTPLRAVALLMILGALFSPLSAEERASLYNRITLSVSAADEIESDTLVAQLYVQKEGQIASQLANETNRDIEWAIQRAKRVPGITVQTLDYHTTPTYHKQSQTGWRVKQSLRLTSQDTVAMSQLIGELQQRLMVDNIRYKISQKRQDEAENRLITQAIAAFKVRAALISSAWGHTRYRLVQMGINTSDSAIPRLYQQRTMMKSEALSAPALTAGKQTVQVIASGIIELQR